MCASVAVCVYVKSGEASNIAHFFSSFLSSSSLLSLSSPESVKVHIMGQQCMYMMYHYFAVWCKRSVPNFFFSLHLSISADLEEEMAEVIVEIMVSS